MKIENLPDDINKLKALLIKELQEKDQQLDQKEQYILELKDIITLLQRRRFAPKSEKNKNQLQLFNELEDIIDTSEAEEIETEVKPHTRKRGKRKPLPENLKRVENIIDLSDEEKTGMKYIGEETSEELVIEPANM